ncbi:hypothetical protein M5K25_014483 [Dendrobium thyrsiflorum]|uniref:Uncharacterized protein n=1 Tax=Dendrobium thyrsiflorum TaxID=117978 RepID=A0ABD0UWF3_DENTH
MKPFSGFYIIIILLLALISVFCLQSNSDGPRKSPFRTLDLLPLLPLSVSWPILRSLYSAVDLLPTFVGVVSSPETKLRWKGACFYNNTAWMEFHNKSKSTYGGGTLHIKVTNAHSWTCMDFYVFATQYRVTWDYYSLPREHTLEFDEWESEEEYEHVKHHGVSIYLVRSGMLGTLRALWDVFSLFTNTEWGENSNVAFLRKHMDAIFEERPKPWFSNINVDDKKCSYPNINGCRTCSQDNLMRSFFNSHGQLSEPDFSKFFDKEICSGDLCEVMLVNSDIFELSSLLRELMGEGSHRQLVTTMEFYHHPKFTHFVNEHSCEAIVIEYLPIGVFSDPFELQRLVDREVFLSASVFGDTNLELPSALSNISVVEIHINVKTDSQKIVVQLPLHSRYPPLSSSDYINITIGKPHLFIRCKPKISRTVACSWTLIDLGVLFGNNVTWRIPCGNAVQKTTVTTITFLSAIFCSLFIVFPSLEHDARRYEHMVRELGVPRGQRPRQDLSEAGGDRGTCSEGYTATEGTTPSPAISQDMTPVVDRTEGPSTDFFSVDPYGSFWPDESFGADVALPAEVLEVPPCTPSVLDFAASSFVPGSYPADSASPFAKLQERITRRQAAADVAHEQFDRSTKALRRHRQSSSSMSSEIEGLSARLNDLWRDIKGVMSKLSDLLEKRDQCDRLIRREQQRYQTLHQEMVVADTALAQAVEELQTAEAEYRTQTEVAAQLRDLQARLL